MWKDAYLTQHSDLLRSYDPTFYIGGLPPDKAYPHTHVQEALVYGLVGFIAGTTSCTIIRHHRLGEVAFTTTDSDGKCLAVGGNLWSDLSLAWGKGQSTD